MHLTIANAAAAVVIRRVNFPRNLTRAMTRAEVERAVPQSLLSEHDEQEVRQTVALVLVRAGIPAPLSFWTDKMPHTSEVRGWLLRNIPRSTWRAMFKEVRRVLRLGRKCANEAPTAPEDFADVPHYGPVEVENEPARRSMLARRANYLRACIAASFAVDPSRKRKAMRRSQLAYLRMATRALSGFGHGAPDTWHDDSARRVAKHAFLNYVRRGEEELTRRALADLPAHAQREFKSFGQLPAALA